jgi:hypothetical protein
MKIFIALFFLLNVSISYSEMNDSFFNVTTKNCIYGKKVIRFGNTIEIEGSSYVCHSIGRNDNDEILYYLEPGEHIWYGPYFLKGILEMGLVDKEDLLIKYNNFEDINF